MPGHRQSTRLASGNLPLCFDVLASAAGRSGAPGGTLGIVHGQQAGATLVAHPAIRAVGFTGSVTGGRALLDIISGGPTRFPSSAS
jgi:NADP-dependent aldehyde dehydrogenase